MVVPRNGEVWYGYGSASLRNGRVLYGRVAETCSRVLVTNCLVQYCTGCETYCSVR